MRVVISVVELSVDLYKANCPALPGCVVLARSRQEAAERMSQAVSGYLASFDVAVPGQIELQVVEPAGVRVGPGGPSRLEREAVPG